MSRPEDPTELADGRYVVIRVLGEGAQGDTLEAVDKREGRLVAVKRFRVRGARSWKDVELAEREARVLRGLSHPALPRYVEHFEQTGCLYLVMESIQGESLQALRRRGEPLSYAEVRRFLEEMGRVLDYLHGRAPPIVHRDIKPGNVIRREDGSFALVDFGAVRDSLKPEGGSTVVGTFGYMAPEQFQGRALPASDVYATGATALTLLTGQEPEELPHKGLGIDVTAALRGLHGRELTHALERMLEPDPDQRATRIAPLLTPARDSSGAGFPRDARATDPTPFGWRAVHGGRAREASAEDLKRVLPFLLALLTIVQGFGRATLDFVAVLVRVVAALRGRSANRQLRALERAHDRLARTLATAREHLNAAAREEPPDQARRRRRVRITDDREGVDTEAEAYEGVDERPGEPRRRAHHSGRDGC